MAYTLLAFAARLTVVDGQTVSLVWPGAGVAMLWLLAESPRHQARVLVPLTLKRMGYDPALASSIFLTTVTDVMGFFTFLGLATVILLR